MRRACSGPANAPRSNCVFNSFRRFNAASASMPCVFTSASRAQKLSYCVRLIVISSRGARVDFARFCASVRAAFRRPAFPLQALLLRPASSPASLPASQARRPADCRSGRFRTRDTRREADRATPEPRPNPQYPVSDVHFCREVRQMNAARISSASPASAASARIAASPCKVRRQRFHLPVKPRRLLFPRLNLAPFPFLKPYSELSSFVRAMSIAPTTTCKSAFVLLNRSMSGSRISRRRRHLLQPLVVPKHRLRCARISRILFIFACCSA